MYQAYIARISNIQPIEGADFIRQATVLGTTVIVDHTTEEGDMGVLFPADGQLSEEFATVHDLVSRKDENGNRVGGYFDHRRRVTALRLRGVKSEGFWMPLSSLAYTGVDASELQEGMAFTHVNNKEICTKYFSPATKRQMAAMTQGKKVKSIEIDFPEHGETTNIKYVKVPTQTLVHVTLKMHGTSVRFGNVKVTERKKPWYGFLFPKAVKITESFQYFLGTRRAILPKRTEGPNTVYSGGFYGNGEPYAIAHKELHGKLLPGEIVYGEVVGYLPDGKPLFSHATSSLKDLKKVYGAKMDYHYGNQKGEASFYVYKIIQNGRLLTRFEVEKRAQELGVKVVPLLWRGFIEATDDRDISDKINQLIEEFGDGPDPVGISHLREGVCILAENVKGINCYKFKNHSFLVLEGLAKGDDDEVDIEEAS